MQSPLRLFFFCAFALISSHALSQGSQNNSEPSNTTDNDRWLTDVRESFGTAFGDLTERWRPQPSPPEEDIDAEATADEVIAPPTLPGAGNVNPGDPEHLALIEEWLRIARPAANAEGASLQFDSWGRVFGVTAGGLLMHRPEVAPDPLLAATPAGHAWAWGQKLRSVDHCMLDEFVVARIESSDLGACRSSAAVESGAARVITDVRSMPAAAAAEFLRSEGYRVSMTLGETALEPDDAFTISEQFPGPGGYGRSGTDVQLTVLAAPEGRIVLPDVLGQPAADARLILERLGLTASLQSLGYAPEESSAFTVRVSDPLPGSAALEGDNVQLSIYLEHRAQAAVPELTGLTGGEARRALIGAGFLVSSQSAGQAPGEDQAFRVASVEPQVGTLLATGSVVRIDVFGSADRSFEMLDVRGVDYRAARRQLMQKGLEVELDNRGETRERDQAFRISEQNVQPGTRVAPGDRVRLGHYDQFQERVTVPGLLGTHVDRAVEVLSDLGLSFDVRVGQAAESNAQVSLVTAQSISVGTLVEPRTVVRLTVYDRSIQNQVAGYDCSRFSGAESFWDGSSQQPGCRCRSGFEIQADGRSCRSVADIRREQEIQHQREEDRRLREDAERREWEEQERRRLADEDRRWEQERIFQEEQWERQQAIDLQRCPDLYWQMIAETKNGDDIAASFAESEAWSIGCDPVELARIMQPVQQAIGGGWLDELDPDTVLMANGIPIDGRRQSPSGGGGTPPRSSSQASNCLVISETTGVMSFRDTPFCQDERRREINRLGGASRGSGDCGSLLGGPCTLGGQY